MIVSFKVFESNNDKQKEFTAACGIGDVDTVKKLIKDVDPTVNNHWALSLAANNGHLEVVKTLLEDPRVDPSDDDNVTIAQSSRGGYLEIVKELLKDPRVDPSDANNVAIRWATKFGHSEVVQELIQDKRVDPSTDNNWAIRHAAKRGFDDITYLLLNQPKVYNTLSEEKIKIYAKGRPLVRDMIKKMNESIKIDGYNFNMGDCDIFAISLHRLHGYPLCAVRGKFLEPEWGGEREWDYEYCHIAVKLPNGNYMDSNGEQTKEELIADCHFSEDVKEVDIVDIKENDAMAMFSCTDQEEDIKYVMKHLKKMGEINESIYETPINTTNIKNENTTYWDKNIRLNNRIMKINEFLSSPMTYLKDLGYDIKTSLGHGQQGSVYLTKDNKAVKLINNKEIDRPIDVKLLDKCIKEDFKYLVNIYDYKLVDDYLIIEMEYINGGNMFIDDYQMYTDYDIDFFEEFISSLNQNNFSLKETIDELLNDYMNTNERNRERGDFLLDPENKEDFIKYYTDIFHAMEEVNKFRLDIDPIDDNVILDEEENRYKIIDYL